jgi:hypothetical protein
MLVVLGGGLAVMAVATTVLYLAFRAAKGGRSMHMGLIAFLVIFVFACCAVLFALAYAADR